MKKNSFWEWEITRKTPWFGANFQELYSFRDLLVRLVRKEFLMYYQQTLLGPLWMVIQPILTVLTYVLIFDKVIGLQTQGVPPFLFYLTGITLWSLFSDIFLGTSGTFSQNAHIFSKVYFPRIIAPIAILLLHLLRFLIQLLILIIVLSWYYFTGRFQPDGNWLLSIPVIIMTACVAFGSGLIFSVFTAMYRDLMNLQQLLVRLLMFLCPIFYALAMVPADKKWLVSLNPLSSFFEVFRFAFIGKGNVSLHELTYSAIWMVVLVTVGILLFNKRGDKLMDVI
ncbi:MAG TPA: ABC transporter permease [Flavitalea sp.]|nr:ABC transporter permease [Flavitalea sp.]